MTPVFLSRIQFALTIGFHYIFPPLSIGLSLLLVALEGLYLKTKKPHYLSAAKFWVGIFGVIFAIGVATGLVMEFEFGTNWASYSRFVGDVFGSPLAAEGLMAFFLESTFLGVLLLGWNRVSPGVHFLSTCLVALGSHLSAFWIVVANSWMQTPAGYTLVTEHGVPRAHITDFWAMVFNPSTLPRLSHVYLGCWLAGSFFAMSVAALYLLLNRHVAFAKTTLKIGLVIAALSSIGQLFTGHGSARQVAETQPAKLAAFEAHYPESAPGDLYLLGWVDTKNECAIGLKIPGMLSWLVSFDASKPLPGLKSFPSDERPPVEVVFQTYHLMVGIGMALIGLSFFALFLWTRGKLFTSRPFLFILVPSFLLPQAANQLGWISAEVGRQPWIVYKLLKTSEAVSKTLSTGEVLFSLVLFGSIYTLLFLAFVYLLYRKIRQGPENEFPTPSKRGV
jgi:cytochrome d ubiquinol oxidase subunit I